MRNRNIKHIASDKEQGVKAHRLPLISILLLLAPYSLLPAQAQEASGVPSLVVNIVIDQLRNDYLDAFTPLYGQGGFLRLKEKSRFYTQAEYPFSTPDRASAMACLMTGTSPYVNGIVGSHWLDRQSLLPVFCVDDETYPGFNTSEKSSPKHLAVSTISDELKISSEGKSIVLSIAPTREAAVLGAGHAANGAFWLDDWTGKWASTCYYDNYPDWATDYEIRLSLDNRISDIVWTPLNDQVADFNYFVSDGVKGKAFSHKFKGDRKFREFKATACVNDEVNLFAKQAIEKVGLGTDAVTDMLTLTYYAGAYDHQSAMQYGMEMQDTYARLDRQLEELFDFVDQKVGMDKTLFVVTSTGYFDSEELMDLSKYRIPTGIFSITKAQLLLNMYLIACYGQGNYVETAIDNQLYLNLKLIENRSLNLAEVLDRCSAFLIQLSGVKDVYTSQRLSLGAWTPGISKLRNAYNPKCSGDILIQVSPGWLLKNEDTHDQSLSRESYLSFPLFFLGSGIEPEKVRVPVTIDRVAPTVAQALRIRAPNACPQAPLNY
ncbi:MAG: alkaline phosphatase family protein [Bacteroidaceae bacterium]|nr:alkaline phosphatase family protein [Bacteroidaceae bacterium]